MPYPGCPSLLLDIVAHFALQAHVGNQSHTSLGIHTRKVAGIRVTIGITILHIKDVHEINSVFSSDIFFYSLKLICFFISLFVLLMVIAKEELSLVTQLKSIREILYHCHNLFLLIVKEDGKTFFVFCQFAVVAIRQLENGWEHSRSV